MDFPVSFDSTGSGKSPSGLPGSLNAPKGIEEGFRKVPLGTSRFIKCPEGYIEEGCSGKSLSGLYGFLLFQRLGGQQ